MKKTLQIFRFVQGFDLTLAPFLIIALISVSGKFVSFGMKARLQPLSSKLIVHIFGRKNGRAGEMHARLEDTQHAGNTVI